MKTLIIAMILHFIADFLFQSREMGKKKSSEPIWLAKHLAIQFTFFLILGWKFALLNTIVHGIIDWNIWGLYKLSAHKRIVNGLQKKGNYTKETYNLEVKNWQYWEDHWFYATIGFDQLLHMLTIVVLWGLL